MRSRQAAERTPWPSARALTLAVGSALLAAALPASALDPRQRVADYGLDQWSIEQGLPSDGVRSVTQTPDGYLWLATAGGLVRFDGARFVVFNRRNTPAIPDNSVEVLETGGDGAIWAGTYNAGLIRHDADGWSVFDLRDGLPNADVTSLLAEPDGTLWIGTAVGGLTRRRGKSFATWGVEDGLCGARVRSLARGAGGTIWIGTQAGLARFQGGTFTCLTEHDGLADNDVRAVYEDRSGNVWIGTESGFHRLTNGQIHRFRPSDGLLDARVRALLEDRDGNLWIGTEGGDVNRYRSGRFQGLGTGLGLRQERVSCLYEDREGSLWIGTRSGLSRLKTTKFNTIELQDDVANRTAQAALQDRDGSLWLGTDNGVNHIDRGRVRHYGLAEGLADLDVQALWQDTDGTLWVATWRGLSRMRNGRLEPFGHNADPFFNVIHRDRTGILWLGGKALRKLDKNGNATRIDELPNGNVFAIEETRDGTLWVGGQFGLAFLRNGHFHTYDPAEMHAPNAVNAILEDDDGSLWLGTRRGLVRVKDDRVTSFASPQGLPETVVGAVMQDGRGALWITSTAGLFRVRREDLAAFADRRARRLTFEHYGMADGLKSTECATQTSPAAFRMDDGRLLVPTLRGAVIFDPVAFEKKNRDIPPVYVEEVRADDRRVAEGASLPPGTRKFELHYTALSLLIPEKVRFRYKLEGFDRDWVEPTPQRVAYYTNLASGSYVFRVQGANDDGAWNDAGAAFHFSLRPHLYERWPFQALAALAIVGVALAVHRLRVRYFHSEQQRLAREVQARTADLARANGELGQLARLKDEFLANMSTELRTPLNAILTTSESLQEGTAGEVTPEQRDCLRMMESSGRHLLSVIDDILDVSRIQEGEMELEISRVLVQPLASASLKFVQESAYKKQLQLSSTVSPDVEAIQADERRLRQVLINLLSNAVKFTPPGGQIGLDISRDRRDGVVRFTVWDTGIGISPENAAKLFQPFVQVDASLAREYSGTGLGLALVYRMISLHGGSVSLESQVGKGSRFSFFLPASAAIAADAEAAKETETESPAPSSDAPLVLVVDDNEASRITLQKYLLSRGYRVALAEDGVQAVERTRAKRPDVVLMDVQMPGMDGLEATRRIRADPAVGTTPIIALTALAMPADRVRCFEAGANDYQAKPLSLRRVLTVIEKQIGRAAPRGRDR